MFFSLYFLVCTLGCFDQNYKQAMLSTNPDELEEFWRKENNERYKERIQERLNHFYYKEIRTLDDIFYLTTYLKKEWIGYEYKNDVVRKIATLQCKEKLESLFFRVKSPHVRETITFCQQIYQFESDHPETYAVLHYLDKVNQPEENTFSLWFSDYRNSSSRWYNVVEDWQRPIQSSLLSMEIQRLQQTKDPSEIKSFFRKTQYVREPKPKPSQISVLQNIVDERLVPKLSIDSYYTTKALWQRIHFLENCELCQNQETWREEVGLIYQKIHKKYIVPYMTFLQNERYFSRNNLLQRESAKCIDIHKKTQKSTYDLNAFKTSYENLQHCLANLLPIHEKIDNEEWVHWREQRLYNQNVVQTEGTNEISTALRDQAIAALDKEKSLSRFVKWNIKCYAPKVCERTSTEHLLVNFTCSYRENGIQEVDFAFQMGDVTIIKKNSSPCAISSYAYDIQQNQISKYVNNDTQYRSLKKSILIWAEEESLERTKDRNASLESEYDDEEDEEE